MSSRWRARSRLCGGAALTAMALGGGCEPLDIPLFPVRGDAGPGQASPDARSPEPEPPAPVQPDEPGPAACAPGAAACLACVQADRCEDDEVCHPLSGECVQPCEAEQACSRSNLCNLELRVCVECLDADDCDDDDLPICDQRSGVCIECVTSDDCTDDPEERPICLTALGICGCSTDDDCAEGSCEGGECDDD